MKGNEEYQTISFESMCSPGNYIRQKNYRFVLSRTGDQIFSKFEIEHFQGLLISCLEFENSKTG